MGNVLGLNVGSRDGERDRLGLLALSNWSLIVSRLARFTCADPSLESVLGDLGLGSGGGRGLPPLFLDLFPFPLPFPFGCGSGLCPS